jgi:hypothetical protein
MSRPLLLVSFPRFEATNRRSEFFLWIQWMKSHAIRYAIAESVNCL